MVLCFNFSDNFSLGGWGSPEKDWVFVVLTRTVVLGGGGGLGLWCLLWSGGLLWCG